MEYFNYNMLKERKYEIIVLLIYSLYDISMVLAAWRNRCDEWIPVVLAVEAILSWIVFLAKYKTYRFRAIFTTAMMQGSIILYAIYVGEYLFACAVFMVFVIIVGLYRITASIYITVGVLTFLVFYHMAKGTFVFASFYVGGRYLLLTISVYFVEFVMYYMVKKQNESNVSQSKIIEELKAAERSKDNFLANVSHEIRTPINTICGMSEVVLHKELPETIVNDIFHIQTAGRNLMSVVSDILDFSEMQSGKMEIVEETYNITSTINDIINMTMARKCEKHIELIVDCDAGIPCGLVGDEQKIRRVIMNLVNNAIKFTDDGCVSIIITYRKEEYGINLAVTVRDTGIGMKEESLEKVFAKFNQVDVSSSRQEGGIGLGLSISQAIIHKMNGVIKIKSQLEKGSEIQFVIPQKVVDESPIIHVNHRESISALVYINMEQFEMSEIRDEYASNIRHLVQQLNVKCHVCRNLAELKRRAAREQSSHVFIGLEEYQEDRVYFDEMSLLTKLIIIIDRPDEKYIKNKNIIRIYKPFYILPIVLVLNSKTGVRGGEHMVRQGHFVAPEAHILVVDDNLMNIRVIEGILQNYQIRVTVAESGKEALEKIETKEYDFVFMDHMMPVMDGVETLHKIRCKPGKYFTEVPVIALTANAIAGTREMFLAEGFTDFLPKPVETSVLERVLKRNLPENKIIPLQENEEERKKQPEMEEKELIIGDLNVEKGLLYCGGRDRYLSILKAYRQEGEDHISRIEQLYKENDWKNYTIEVHGVKSSMLSIGAEHLSELAAKLEKAGKAGNVDIIRNSHGEMIDEYRRLIKELQEISLLQENENTGETEENLPVLEDSEFEQMTASLENAMYVLDGGRMREILAELQKYQYHGVPLAKSLEQIQKKVEMSDYMSAVEAVQRLGNKLKEQEGKT